MPSKNVKIDVTVNVEKLYNGGSIDDCCSLSDDNGGSTPTGKPEQFQSKVYAAKKVTWEPEKVGDNVSDYDLDLTSVDYESGDNIFGSDSLPGGSNGKVTGKVKSSASVGEKEKYIVKFTITKKRGAEKTFEIDPDLDVDNDD